VLYYSCLTLQTESRPSVMSTHLPSRCPRPVRRRHYDNKVFVSVFHNPIFSIHVRRFAGPEKEGAELEEQFWKMKTFYALVLLLALSSSSAFVMRPDALRIASESNAGYWIRRTESYPAMLYAFSDNITTPGVGHGVNGVGLYIPRDHALEYDGILFTLEAIIGFEPVSLVAKWDPSSIEWVGTDILKVYYFADDQAGFNFTTGGYDLIADNFRYIEYITFAPNSPLITLGYSYPEEAERLFFEVINSATTPQALCGLISAACLNGPYANDTGFTSYGDCLNFITSLGPDVANKCPYKNTGNTIACRNVHATLALIDPAIHCAHVARVSVKCFDSCYPSCSNCNANAHCVGTPNTVDFTTSYACVCNTGYKGNGTNCVAQTCTANYQCNAAAGTGGCVNGQCSCGSTFQWNQVTGKCDCPLPSRAYWLGKGKNATQECIPQGSCNERYQCTQDWDQVKCRSVGNNVFVKYKCFCNRGFGGGIELDCECPNGREVWSELDEGEVCLTGLNCVHTYDCQSPKVCVGGNNVTFGVCT